MSVAAFERDRRALGVWLLVCCAFVGGMLLVGGWTRLRHAGLSIVEWAPVTGALPPLGEAAWNQAFLDYQATPEFQQVHHHISLAHFKTLYWYEWSHRFLGRVTGLVFAVPFVVFLVRRSVTGALARRLSGLFALGGFQGFIGWWMVSSGLVDRPDVSQLRLATHLGLALLLFQAMFWTALSLLDTQPSHAAPRPLRRAAGAFWILVFCIALSGALVAGLDAGFIFNTFPRMGDRWVPAALLAMQPAWVNPFENPVTAQFQHRVLAIAALGLGIGLRVWVNRVAPTARLAANAMIAALALQVGLGIATLLSFVWLPLASAHQLGALVLLTTATWLMHALRGR